MSSKNHIYINIDKRNSPIIYSYFPSSILCCRLFNQHSVIDADSALASKKSKDEKDSAVDVACDWLRSQLENQPPKPAKDLLSAAKAEGITKTILHKAKQTLGIEIKKVGFKGAYVWLWPSSQTTELLG